MHFHLHQELTLIECILLANVQNRVSLIIQHVAVYGHAFILNSWWAFQVWNLKYEITKIQEVIEEELFCIDSHAQNMTQMLQSSRSLGMLCHMIQAFRHDIQHQGQHCQISLSWQQQRCWSSLFMCSLMWQWLYYVQILIYWYWYIINR